MSSTASDSYRAARADSRTSGGGDRIVVIRSCEIDRAKIAGFDVRPLTPSCSIKRASVPSVSHARRMSSSQTLWPSVTSCCNGFCFIAVRVPPSNARNSCPDVSAPPLRSGQRNVGVWSALGKRLLVRMLPMCPGRTASKWWKGRNRRRIALISKAIPKCHEFHTSKNTNRHRTAGCHTHEGLRDSPTGSIERNSCCSLTPASLRAPPGVASRRVSNRCCWRESSRDCSAASLVRSSSPSRPTCFYRRFAAAWWASSRRPPSPPARFSAFPSASIYRTAGTSRATCCRSCRCCHW